MRDYEKRLKNLEELFSSVEIEGRLIFSMPEKVEAFLLAGRKYKKIADYPTLEAATAAHPGAPVFNGSVDSCEFVRKLLAGIKPGEL